MVFDFVFWEFKENDVTENKHSQKGAKLIVVTWHMLLQHKAVSKIFSGIKKMQ